MTTRPQQMLVKRWRVYRDTGSRVVSGDHEWLTIDPDIWGTFDSEDEAVEAVKALEARVGQRWSRQDFLVLPVYVWIDE